MKHLLLLSVFISSFGFGQFSNNMCDFEKEITSSFHLPKQYKQQILKIKKDFIRRMYNDTTSELCYGKLSAESYLEFYHRYDTAIYVYDFNYDGKKDILFFGRKCPGYESTDVSIFYRVGKEYSIQRLGTWIISMDLEKTNFKMTLVKYPCCADFMLQAMKYERSKGDDSIQQLTNQVFGYDECDEQIQSIDTTFSFTQDKKVMIYPDLNSEELEMFSYDGGALIGTLQKNTVVTSSNRIFLNGKMWYYAVIEINKSFLIEENWNNDHFGKITTVRGWISE